MKEINKLIAELKEAEVSLHFEHLTTYDHVTHEATEIAYKELNTIIDRLFECCSMEYRRLNVPTVVQVTHFNQRVDLINYLDSVRRFIDSEEGLDRYTAGVRNILGDASELMMQTIYRLSLE